LLLFHVGIDDTDSPQGGCTTYVACKLAEKFGKLGAKFVDYPNLLRLNPNVPWKTRGNASVSLRLEVDPGLVEPIKEAVIHEVEADARFECSNTNPGVAFHEGRSPGL